MHAILRKEHSLKSSLTFEKVIRELFIENKNHNGSYIKILKTIFEVSILYK